jgi:hypothetical protein
MGRRSRTDAAMKVLAILCSVLCGVGAVAAMFVVLVRLPALAGTRLELLFGTLQGVAVGLLFAIAALLINLTFMVRRASRTTTHPLDGDGRLISGRSGPSA